MKKSYLLIALIMACSFYACKKDNLSSKAQNSKLIIGNWKSYQQNTKVYTLGSNELLKDSTVVFDEENAGRAWFESFDANGNAYVTVLTRKLGATVATPDTTNYAAYTILGTNLTLKQHIGGTQTKPILTISLTNLGLQYSYTSTLNAGWGLGTEGNYKIVQATYYTRQ
jgi:hypothetical protein